MTNEKAPKGLDFWLPIGIATVALLGVVVMVYVSWPNSTPAPAPSSAAGGTPPAMQPPAIQSPRAAADELFNRAMMAHETGRVEQAATLLPQAIEAYRSLEPLDADGLFHLASLQLALGIDAEARATSDRILAQAPNNLLGLASAARASERSAPNDAREFWQRYLDASEDQEQGRLPEYAHHQQMFPMLNQRANEYIARASGDAIPPGGMPNQPVP